MDFSGTKDHSNHRELNLMTSFLQRPEEFVQCHRRVPDMDGLSGTPRPAQGNIGGTLLQAHPQALFWRRYSWTNSFVRYKLGESYPVYIFAS